MGQLIEFLADIGDTIEKHLSSGAVALLVVLLAWIHHGLSAIFVTLLVASSYVKKQREAEAAEEGYEEGFERESEVKVGEEKRRGNGDFVLIMGAILVLGGIYWLIRELLPQVEVNWPVALILLGALLVVLGLREREERSP
ncbi:MAG TPA: hypothetical protein ENF57_00495 [Candidatus Korarchaeota archaeon]|nr:hypothetical protein [Candidatus Korarchaeota archaeon]